MSVLFADMSGSVATFHGSDPESAADRVNEVLAAMVQSVTDHGGTVDRFLGDGLLALFGAREAHEDDPVRAVTAAVDLTRQVAALGVSATAGVNTGPVYVGQVGSARHAETTAMGPVVNLAARLQGQAGPGEVIVAAEAARHCGGAFHLVERALTIKGIPGPVTAYAVAGEKARPVRRLRPNRARTIGREDELRRLDDAAAALGRGSGGAVLVVGEAGLGKSRLVAEVVERVAATASVLEGRCFESAAAALQPFADAIHGFLGWDPATPDDDRAADIERLASAVDGRDRSLAPALAAATGVRVDHEDGWWAELPSVQRQREMFRAVRLLIDGLGRQQPVVLVLEDLHWADVASIELTVDLLAVAAERPVLVVCAYRPAPEHPVAALAAQAELRCPRTTQLVLRELDDGACAAIAAEVLGVDGLPGEVRAAVLGRAQGNPLFVEEVIRSAVDTGWLRKGRDGEWAVADGSRGAHPVPDTLELLVRSRIDRLPAATRRVLQLAALQGRVFSAAVLGALEGPNVVAEALLELAARDLTFPTPERGPDEWSFKHVLVQETIEQGILRRAKPDFHRRILDALEVVHQGREAEQAAQLARHAEAAGDAERSVRHLRAAGLNAKASHANDLAADLLGRALRWAGESDVDDAVRSELHEHRGDVLHRGGRHGEAVTEYQAAAGLATGALERARLHRKLAGVAVVERSYDEAGRRFQQAVDALGPTPSVSGPALTEWLDIRLAMAGYHYWRNEPAAIAAITDEIAPVVEVHGTDLQRAEALQLVMMRRLREDRYRVDADILDHAERSAALAAGHADPGLRAFKRFNLAFCRLWARQLDAALTDFDAAIEDGARAGDVVVLSRCHTYRAVAHRFGLDEPACEAAIADAMSSAGDGGMVEYVAAAEANRSWVALRRGDVDAVLRHAAAAIAMWETTALVYGFQWTARFPLLAVAREAGDERAVAEQLQWLTRPDQQRLPVEVETPLLAGDVSAAIEAGRALGYV